MVSRGGVLELTVSAVRVSVGSFGNWFWSYSVDVCVNFWFYTGQGSHVGAILYWVFCVYYLFVVSTFLFLFLSIYVCVSDYCLVVAYGCVHVFVYFCMHL